ncbi:MAG: 1,4-dihydroxy-2-naphthoate polyprenyltransferase [Acidimicrobiia bacterium]
MKAWLVAARPPTLLAAVAPVLVGSGLAAADDVFRWDAFAAVLVGAVLINLAANFANDASDAKRGTDTAERIGPPRAVATGLLTARQVWTGAAIVVGLAAVLGAYLAWISSWVIIVIGVASVLAMLGYTGGPWPYGYRALGELFVFTFFGPVAVVGSRYVHDTTAPLDAWLLAIPVGFLVTAILVTNNVRDIDTDRVVGKRTLAVVLGRTATRVLFAALIIGAFVLIAVFAAVGATQAGTLLALLALPFALQPIRIVSTKVDGPSLISALEANARLHVIVGLLLAIGVQL